MKKDMQFGMPTLVENKTLEEHTDRLIHFHVHDGSENPPKNHLALGDGEIDLDDRLKLAELRNARCVLETKTVAALEKSVEYLK